MLSTPDYRVLRVLLPAAGSTSRLAATVLHVNTLARQKGGALAQKNMRSNFRIARPLPVPSFRMPARLQSAQVLAAASSCHNKISNSSLEKSKPRPKQPAEPEVSLYCVPTLRRNQSHWERLYTSSGLFPLSTWISADVCPHCAHAVQTEDWERPHLGRLTSRALSIEARASSVNKADLPQ